MRAANPVGPGLQQGPGLNGVPSRQGVDANWNRRYWVGSAYLRNGVGVRIPGVALDPTNKVTSPDHASLQMTGDIDIRVKTRFRNWDAPGPVVTNVAPLCAKMNSSGTVGWRLHLAPATGGLGSTWSIGGVAVHVGVPAPGFDDNTDHWIRVARESATGIVRFYTSPTEDGTTWVQWGADQSTTAGPIGSNAGSELRIGWDGGGNGGAPQIISNVSIWNGIEGSGGVNVFNADFTAQATGTTSFVESNGRTVTITSAAMPWSSLGGWSEESGGVGGASIPTVATEVILDRWSPTLIFAASYTALCGAFDASDYSGTMSMDYSNMVLAVQMGAVPDPRFVLSSAMTFGATTSGGVRVQFQGSGPVEGRINTAGKNMPGTNINGGPWRLDSDYTTNNANLSIFLNAGGWLKTNGYTVGSKTVPWVTALASTTTTRRLDLGSSTWWTSSWGAGNSGLFIDPGTSTINVVGVAAGFAVQGGQRYNTVAFPAVQSSISTYGGLSRNGTSGTVEIAHLIVRNLSTSNYAGTTANPTACWSFGPNSGSWRITDMTIEGQPGSPVLVQGAGWGAAGGTINVANAPTLSNVTFTDTTAGGASAPWSGTRLGDGGGNTSITFPVSQTNYWVASTPGLTGTGLYCGTTNGSSSAGGSSRWTYASTPDSVPLSVLGDIDVRVKFSGRITREVGTEQDLLCKGTPTASLSYSLSISYLGSLNLTTTANGFTARSATSTEALWPLKNYTAGWVRATRVSSTGVTTFYTSDDGVAWTQLGSTVATTAGAIYDGSGDLYVGRAVGGTPYPFDGTLLRAQVYDGIAGTLVFDADFETAPAAALSFIESSVNAATVTVVPFAATSNGAHTDAAHWASSTGGASGSGRVPLAHDDVVYDGNSGTGRPQWDAPEVGRNVTGTGATVGIIDLFPRYMAGGATTQTRVWGSLTAGNLTGVTWTTGASSLDFCGRGSTFTHSIGSAFGWGDLSTSIVSYIRFYPLPSTTHALGSALNTTWGIAQPASLSTGGGTFDAGVHDVTCWSFTDGLTTQVRTIDFGSGAWTLTGTSGTVLSIPNQANLTMTGTPTWVVAESLDARVVGGKWRVPQYGTDPSNTTRATTIIATDTTANSWQTPRPATALTGDLDIIVRFCPDFTTQANTLISAANALPASNLTWSLSLSSSTQLRLLFAMSTSGSTWLTPVTSASVPYGNGVTWWLRVTRDRAAGEVKFYYCADQPTVPTAGQWIELSTSTGLSTSTLFAGTSDLTVGYIGSITYGANVRGLSVYHAQVSNTIGGAPVATLDFTSMDDYALSTTDPQGNVWRSYQYGARTTRRVVGGTTIGYTVGSSNVWATPDSTALSITSDLELVIRCRPSTWTPTGGAFLINKFETTGNQRSYAWNISATGNLVFTRNATGSASNIVYTSTGTGLTAGVAYWLKMTYDQTDGAVSRCRFYYAADQATEPSVWTEIGTGVTSADVTGIYDSTAPLQIGIGSGAATTLNGEIWRAIVRNGIGGTTVFDADFSNLQDDTYAFRESSANNAVVYASSNGSTGSPGGRTVKNFIVNNKTLPGSALTLQGGGGGTLLIAGSSNPSHTHGYPAIVSTGGKWLAAGDGSYGIQQFAAITWTTSATGPRNALVRGPAVTQSRWSSDGVVTVSYADVLYNDADGASIPFSNVNGLLSGTTDWIDENIYPDYIILGMQNP